MSESSASWSTMRTVSTPYGADALEEVDDAFFVVGETVGVEAFADGRVSGCALFVLVEDPFEGGAAAEAVLPG